ncbi:hypothetical protein [Solimonas soli]|uniref:hypothetical protein n=1 Tax=Solimonas soli TaxID=413479 RepID=UPI0004AC82F3|nr:hypothetical protein [Solimonas soli]
MLSAIEDIRWVKARHFRGVDAGDGELVHGSLPTTAGSTTAAAVPIPAAAGA